MQSQDLQALRQAKTLIDELMATRYLGIQPAASFGATDFSGLHPEAQQEEVQLAQDQEIGNRMRAALHLCLSASSVAIEVGEKLMGAAADMTPAVKAELLLRCSEDAMAASEAARHAAAVLANDELPETDAFFDE